MPSTVVRHISYDEGARELHIVFTSGEVYTYYNVPKPVYAAFRAAFSKGQFFNAHIKERYDFRRHARSA
jgi:lysyl-tRNA synthetase class 2